MIRRSTLMWTAMAVLVGTGLFLVKHRVQALEDRLAALNHDIAEDREAIHVLNAEWAYLNRPERLEDLGRRLLGYEPAPAAQMARLDDLENRLAAPQDEPKTAKVAAPAETIEAVKRPRRKAKAAPTRQADTARARKSDMEWIANVMAQLEKPR